MWGKDAQICRACPHDAEGIAGRKFSTYPNDFMHLTKFSPQSDRGVMTGLDGQRIQTRLWMACG
jgi:hypothetical protein